MLATAPERATLRSSPDASGGRRGRRSAAEHEPYCRLEETRGADGQPHRRYRVVVPFPGGIARKVRGASEEQAWARAAAVIHEARQAWEDLGTSWTGRRATVPARADSTCGSFVNDDFVAYLTRTLDAQGHTITGIYVPALRRALQHRVDGRGTVLYTPELIDVMTGRMLEVDELDDAGRAILSTTRAVAELPVRALSKAHLTGVLNARERARQDRYAELAHRSARRGGPAPRRTLDRSSDARVGWVLGVFTRFLADIGVRPEGAVLTAPRVARKRREVKERKAASVVTAAEWASLLAVLDPGNVVDDIVLVLHETGGRVNGVLATRFGDIDRDTGVWRLTGTMRERRPSDPSRDSRRVRGGPKSVAASSPLTEALLDLLDRQAARAIVLLGLSPGTSTEALLAERYVFAVGDGTEPPWDLTVRRRLEHLCRTAGIRVIHPHDFRHTYITNRLLEDPPVPPHVVALEVGDSVQTILGTYGHLIEGSKDLSRWRRSPRSGSRR